jgi:octaprenyl-diphosphate synthase
MPSTTPLASGSPELLHRLRALVRGKDLGALSGRLAELADLVATDMVRFEADMPTLRPEANTVERGALHLVDLGGKRLRPICVSLASRLGTGFDHRALCLATAVEMVHAATLLHDDVIDLAETRRGAPTSRMIFGNAVSVFAGDWLLIDALKRVRKAQVPGTLERLLDVIEEMIFAESLQLERRGRLDTTVDQWFEVVTGKTAALFRWGMYAGGRVGGLDDATCEALEQYGVHLGVAFQAIDDVLDLAGDPKATGKALFTDLREGKMTYPLILSMDREPSLRPLVGRVVRGEESEDLYAPIRDGLRRSGALDDCRMLAVEHAELAKKSLAELPATRARAALETVADAVVYRPS